MSRRFDPFRVLSESERQAHMEGYERFLALRNGDIDLEARTLSNREAYFRELAQKPVDWSGDIDHAGFFQHFDATGSPAIDARTVWLVAIAKSNEGESYGVELELERYWRRRRKGKQVDNAYRYLLLEEQYHSQILLEACRVCGLDIRFKTPRWPQRLFIQLIQHLPENLRWIPVLCGEVLGTVVFELLRDGTTVFSEEPEVEERLRSLLAEIRQDEALHVAYLRAKLRPWAIRIARAAVPLVAHGVLLDVPEFLSLGVDRKELVRRLRAGLEIPADADWIGADTVG